MREDNDYEHNIIIYSNIKKIINENFKKLIIIMIIIRSEIHLDLSVLVWGQVSHESAVQSLILLRTHLP